MTRGSLWCWPLFTCKRWDHQCYTVKNMHAYQLNSLVEEIVAYCHFHQWLKLPTQLYHSVDMLMVEDDINKDFLSYNSKQVDIRGGPVHSSPTPLSSLVTSNITVYEGWASKSTRARRRTSPLMSITSLFTRKRLLSEGRRTNNTLICCLFYKSAIRYCMMLYMNKSADYTSPFTYAHFIIP